MVDNNCATCKHIETPDGGHCYMFREEPVMQCMKHTSLDALRKHPMIAALIAVVDTPDFNPFKP
jgi:hypothetical protein